MFGWLAILSLVFKWDMSRGYLAIAFPLGLTGLLIGRKVWRVWLRRKRIAGLATSRVLVVGGTETAQEIMSWFLKHRGAGYVVTGVWVPDQSEHQDSDTLGGYTVPVMGTNHTLLNAVKRSEATTVVVTDTEHLGHRGLKELTWELEGSGIELLVSPSVVDVAGSRIHLRAVASLPLLHLEEPQFAEAGAWPKLAFDRMVAAVLLVVVSPLLALVAVLVRVTSAGPIFYRQERIGREGIAFNMVKFRTMKVGADAELQALISEQGSAETPLFKVKDDPRLTRIGGFMRRYSIDELPQLFNVLKGDMSLVGPRPQRQAEVELYDTAAHRRLHVLPGMTGLWQISGRSDLSWEESIRLDNYYVENWSLVGDLLILWKTVRAVISPNGAY